MSDKDVDPGTYEPAVCAVTSGQSAELNELIERLEDRRRIKWNAPLKDGGYAKLVSPEDLSLAIRQLYRLEALESREEQLTRERDDLIAALAKAESKS